ncbi:MAG: asparaginase [Hydrogenophaga sp.]|uniref:asparaginase n=1 Tax=Hydrogenophaga sp. TaxID=1904254 RepID=UPI003D10F378
MSLEADRWVLLGTGGTIAGQAAQAADNVGYVAGQVGVAELVAAVPTLGGLPLELEQIAQIDSKDMGLAVWQALARRIAVHLERPQVRAVIVTHGTDTIEETAFLIHRLLRPAKPVVFTCAMRPSTALVPDGPQNLSDAMAVARHAGAGGVVVVCAGQVHAARDVAKVHTYRLDAFDSGDAGPLACVEEGRVREFRPWVRQESDPLRGANALAPFLLASELPRVELVTSHADAGGDLIRSLLVMPGERALQGIVVAGTGNGTVHQALTDALHEAQARGVRVRLSSRCARGRVVPHPGLPFEDAGGLSAIKARLALALDLLEG